MDPRKLGICLGATCWEISDPGPINDEQISLCCEVLQSYHHTSSDNSTNVGIASPGRLHNPVAVIILSIIACNLLLLAPSTASTASEDDSSRPVDQCLIHVIQLLVLLLELGILMVEQVQRAP